MITYRRRLLREKVLQVLYAYEISKEPLILVEEQQLDELRKFKNDFEFAKELISQVVQHEADIDAVIKAKATHWEFERIAVVDKILLRMGICELLYFPDIPPKVTINEAIEIAKLFSTTKSGPFINGILDCIHNELKTSRNLHKSGRGLMTESLSDSSLSHQVKPKAVRGDRTVSKKGGPPRKNRRQLESQKGV